MTDFDPIKAIREEIRGLTEIKASLSRRERNLQMQYTELEIEVNAVTLLRGFADAEIERKRKVLKALEEGR